MLFREVFISLSCLLNIYELILYRPKWQGSKKDELEKDTMRPRGHWRDMITSTDSVSGCLMSKHVLFRPTQTLGKEIEGKLKVSNEA